MNAVKNRISQIATFLRRKDLKYWQLCCLGIGNCLILWIIMILIAKYPSLQVFNVFYWGAVGAIMALPAIIVAVAAYKHDRNFFLWHLYGAFLFPIALIHILYISSVSIRDKINEKHIPFVTMFNTLVIIGSIILICAAGMFAGGVALFLAIFIIALLPANIAYRKGRSFALWYIYSIFIWIVAFIHSLAIHNNDNAVRKQGYKKCPYCGEYIRPEATVCRYCGKQQ